VVTAETEGIFALKTKPAATPYYPPAPPAGTGFHRYGMCKKTNVCADGDVKYDYPSFPPLPRAN
jgi:hypothetical protein